LVFALLFTHVRAASAQPKSEASASSQIKDRLTIARVLIAAGDWNDAIRFLEPATRADPSNPEPWFLLGLAHRGAGNEQAAAEAFRHAIELRPALPRPYLELGRSLTALHDYDAAKQAFDQGLALSDNRTVRRNIRTYLQEIDDNRTWNFRIGSHLQPDTNPATASHQKIVVINGVPFVVGGPAQEGGGFGLGLDAALRYAPHLNGTTRWITETGYAGTHFFHTCCSDETWAATTGPAFKWTNLTVAPRVYVRYRLYDGSGYSTEEGAGAAVSDAQPTYLLGAGAEGGVSHLLQLHISGPVVRGFVSADHTIIRSLQAGATIGGERDRYPIPSQSFTAWTLELRSSVLGPWNLPLAAWATFLHRAYDGPTLTSVGNRVDRLVAIGVSVDLDFIALWGVSPTVGIDYETQSSNDPLGRFNRVQVLMGAEKVF